MNLLIRADANVAMGTGHVMRCLALAQAWQDAGGTATFAAAELTASTRKRLSAEACQGVDLRCIAGTVEDAKQTSALAHDLQANWIVVDGYQFKSEYQQAIKDAGRALLFVDDYGHSDHYCADLILNQNINADEKLYAAREPYTRLLLGTEYCLLRREFTAWREWKREIGPAAHKVLVTMGGSDPGNMTARVMEALQLANIKGTEASILVGGSNPHFSDLQMMASRFDFPLQLHRDASNIAELMCRADIAVSAAGSTCWELAFLGLPALLLDLAENQTDVAKQLHKKGCAIHVGSSEVTVQKLAEALRSLAGSHELRGRLSKRSRRLVDGGGSRRVVSALLGNLSLRPVRSDDRELLWHWANDPQVRNTSFSAERISWDTHVAWFSEKITSPDTQMFIAEDERGTPVGQIRFDRRGNGTWLVDVSIAHTMRGYGRAHELIQLGLDAISGKHPRASIHAYVKTSNVASVRGFERSGFRRQGIEKVQGCDAIHFAIEQN